MDLEKLILGEITNGMLLAFAFGNACLITYIWAQPKQGKTKSGYTTRRFMNLTAPNILFHLFAGFTVLLILHEISSALIENFIPQLKGSGRYHMSMAALTGMLGSVLVGFFLEKYAKKRNIVDREIAHTEQPELDQIDDIA